MCEENDDLQENDNLQEDDEASHFSPYCYNCGGTMIWCESCQMWSQTCCEDCGSCMCS
jgi:hypothetical protein